jgi:hypothetical protein
MWTLRRCLRIRRLGVRIPSGALTCSNSGSRRGFEIKLRHAFACKRVDEINLLGEISQLQRGVAACCVGTHLNSQCPSDLLTGCNMDAVSSSLNARDEQYLN